MRTAQEMFCLTGKTAVIIGGTGELCGAIASGMASAGAEVILVGRNAENAARRIGLIDQLTSPQRRCRFVSCDVSSRENLQQLLEEIQQSQTSLDILVNGAGVNSSTPFLEISNEEVDRIINLNFKSVLFGCQVFGRYFLDRGTGGTIINIGSLSGLNPLSRVFTYSASKAAVHNLTKNLAREWGPQGIRVNTLVPGFFPAEQNRKILTPQRVESILSHTPMNRFGEAAELVGAALLLASEAGSFITGSELIVDGGFSAVSI